MKLKYALLLSAISLTLNACGGSSNDSPKPPIVVADTTPDSFSFSEIENAPLNKWVESAPVTITGINTDTPISIENGEYSIDGAPFTVSPGYVTLNQTVVIRVKSHKNSLSEVTAIINVGNISNSFQVTTEARLVFMGWDEQFGNELRATNLLKNSASLVQDINVTLANKLEGEKIKSPVKFGGDLFYCRAETGVEFSDVIYSYNEATKKLISLGSISALCSGQLILATVLYSSQYLFSDSFGVKPAL
ncbi:hypothetical protein [Pseudoalteromonas spongiae]|uniref:hypothetical protein n=1 Tax=Pseudoalteromonas spongiae TaxID=298657 RepID=UPI00110BDD21|nr:hypothetical protein [Pseudoalteromonas spongiae]TMO81699.1 hypothetical protein CWC15_20775 [Pseudoalteromonas spongiae]